MKPPKKIYLQWYGDEGEPPNDIHEGVTWCQDKINDKDIAYVPQFSELRKLERWIKTQTTYALGGYTSDKILDQIKKMRGK